MSLNKMRARKAHKVTGLKYKAQVTDWHLPALIQNDPAPEIKSQIGV
jgi:hypothetical protein